MGDRQAAIPGPDESEADRVVRNFDELLQELRVLQTGVQILFAFLLTLPFTSVFAGISNNEKSVYGFVIIAAASSMGLLIAPVAIHRATFRHRTKATVLKVSHCLTLAGIGVLLVAVGSAVGLATSVATDGDRWVYITSATVAVLLLLWLVLPIAVRMRAPQDEDVGRDPEISPG
ncbi:MAG: DUF6328 family protein [Candidatus Nanopelagicales bacterium]